MKGLRQTVANLFQGLGRLKVRREPEGIFSRSVHGRACACVRDFGSILGAQVGTQNAHEATLANRRAPRRVCCDIPSHAGA